MITYTCDWCGEETASPMKIKLKGYAGGSGRILLPDIFLPRNFCKDLCFIRWVKKAADLDNRDQAVPQGHCCHDEDRNMNGGCRTCGDPPF